MKNALADMASSEECKIVERFLLERALSSVSWRSGGCVSSEEGRCIKNEGGYIELQGSVPVFENILYALGLLKTKSVEHIQEGRELLSKLLAFQNAAGLFPRSIFDFPVLVDTHVSVETGLVLRHIEALGPIILGGALLEKVQLSIKALQADLQQLSIGHQLLFRLHAMGSDIQKKANALQELLAQFSTVVEVVSPRVLGLFICSLPHIVPKDFLFKEEGFSCLLQKALALWHIPSNSYIGFIAPVSHNSPRSSFEWCMRVLFSSQLPKKVVPSNKKGLHELEAVLVHPFVDVVPQNILRAASKAVERERSQRGQAVGALETIVQNSIPESWLLHVSKNIPSYSQRFYFAPLRLFASGFTGVVSLPAGCIQEVIEHGTHVDIICCIDPERVEWGKEGGHLLSWYSDYVPGVASKETESSKEVCKWHVCGERATIFYPGNPISTTVGPMSLELTFLVEGTHARGEILPSIRPCDRGEKKLEHFLPLDWEISFRLLRPPIPQTVTLRIKITTQLA